MDGLTFDLLRGSKELAIRIKSRWHDDDTERSLEEIAGAIAFIAWRIAKDKAIALHGEDFVFDSDEQRMMVIAEYLYFQIQVVDRLTHRMLADKERRRVIVTLALRLAELMQENCQEILGDGDYGKNFIEGLNRRSADYSELGFHDDGPSYAFLRHLGFEVQRVMGQRNENRWVIDQVMDREGPEVAKQLTRALSDLFDW